MTLCFVPGFSRERNVAAITYIDGDWHDGKVQPVTKFEDRTLQPGPVYRRTRELYWDFVHTR